MSTTQQDCISCRVVSTATLSGLGIHALRQSRPTAPGSLAGRRVLGVVGVVLFGMGLVRGFPLVRDIWSEKQAVRLERQ